MGSCMSRSSVPTTAEFARAIMATVVDFDGSMAQLAASVTVPVALAAARRASSSHFLCCSDELYFDAPVRALGAHEALQVGQLYFALPLSMLGRPLSGQDIAALAVKASSALGAAPIVDANRVTTGVPASRDKSAVTGAAGTKQRRRLTGRVAPLVVVYGGYDTRKAAAVYGDRTVGKTRNGAGHDGVTRRMAAVQRLSVIVEAATE